ncbi:MAG: hypothetical protein H0U96_03285 [Acidobacteria bacterium]|nr:hypothetical protein [Acidobacteriota bacterium]
MVRQFVRTFPPQFNKIATVRQAFSAVHPKFPPFVAFCKWLAAQIVILDKAKKERKIMTENYGQKF